MTVVDDTADTKIAQQVSQISGVGQVSIGGERKPAKRAERAAEAKPAKKRRAASA